MLFGGRRSSALAAFALSCSVALTARAEGERQFEIPAARLADALKVFAQQSGIQILFAPEAVAQLRSPAIRGNLPPEEALRALLRGTRLAFERTGTNLFVIQAARKADPVDAAPAAPVRQDPVVTAQASAPPAPRRHEGIEEVTVTALKREEKAQDVPMPVIAFSQASLQRMGFSNLTDLAERVPALDVLPNFRSSSALKIYMRGVGQEAPDQIAKDNGVGIYMDDVYVGHGLGMSSELGDIERVEVLPGPQGTLYGRNTLGGAIKFITAKPSGEFSFKQSVDVGDYGLLRASTSVNLPEVAHVSAKLSLVKSDMDGWVKNSGTAGNFGRLDNFGWRAALRWRPADPLTVDYTYDRTRNEGTSDYLQHTYASLFDNHFPIFTSRQDRSWRPANAPMYDNFSGDGHALTVAWSLSAATELKSVSAYRGYSAAFLSDALEGYNVPVYQGIDTLERQYSQEFMLSGAIDEASVSYHVGLFHYREWGQQSYRSARFQLPGPYMPGDPYTGPTYADLKPFGFYLVRNASDAVYGQITWTPRFAHGRFSVDVGGRQSWDTRAIQQYNWQNQPPAPVYDRGEVGYTSFDPSVTLDYKWTAKLHTYAKVARAYMAGGYDPIHNTAYALAYRPEHMLSMEVGLKSQWLHDRLLFNVTAFSERYRDIQLRYTVPATPDYAGGERTINSGHAVIKGVETQFEFVPVRGLTYSAGAAYLNQDTLVTDPFTGVTASMMLPTIPKWKINSALEYTSDPTPVGSVSAGLFYSFHDRELPAGALASGYRNAKPQYSLFDARLSLGAIAVASGEISVTFWARNLADKQYQLYTAAGASIFGMPRNYAVNVLYRH